ncbi:hypothetical protein DSO57_1035075 [Entomophthora muscae]|uniref:Uncharacterized protein n=1 Tax=Entomophthora muscae TaxID=34485 RepID=A0ACC2SNS9_9FUNG|nr:hypothetical protein DSO57_1035075 [Entomophthora muscae]
MIFLITRLLNYAFLPLLNPGNLPPPDETTPEIFKIGCEPIYAAISLTVRQIKAVRIDNSPPLEPQAQEQESNPEPGSPRAARPMDRGTARPQFSGVEPLQADAEDDGPSSEADQAKEIIAPSGVPITTPNGGAQATIISFMSLKSTPATNQEPTQGRGTSPQPGPMTTTLEQDNQVAKLGVSINERTPGLSTILLLLDPSTQFPRPCLSQCPDDPPMENVKFGGGVLYRPKDPTLQTYCHF